jgi:hypothetical protein
LTDGEGEVVLDIVNLASGEPAKAAEPEGTPSPNLANIINRYQYVARDKKIMRALLKRFFPCLIRLASSADVARPNRRRQRPAIFKPMLLIGECGYAEHRL